MDHIEALVTLSARGINHLIKGFVAVLKTFIAAMSESSDSNIPKNIDPRLLSPGTSQEADLQELVAKAQEIRKTMSSSKPQGSGKGKPHHGPSVSPELLSKVDSILAIVQNLQTSQREIYNYVRAMAPRHSIIRTEGPTEHFETVNQVQSDEDNAYLRRLRQSMQRRDRST